MPSTEAALTVQLYNTRHYSMISCITLNVDSQFNLLAVQHSRTTMVWNMDGFINREKSDSSLVVNNEGKWLRMTYAAGMLLCLLYNTALCLYVT